MDKLYYLNMTFEKDMINMIPYFDALEISFFENLFDSIIPDNETFSNEEIQNEIINALSKAPTFKMWDKVKNGNSFYTNNDCSIEYNIVDGVLTLLKISKGDVSFERRNLNV